MLLLYAIKTYYSKGKNNLTYYSVLKHLLNVNKILHRMIFRYFNEPNK